MTTDSALLTHKPTVVRTHLCGQDLLLHPRLNKGTAFTFEERTAFRLHGRWGLAAFAGMEDRSAAEALIGRSLMVRDEDRWPLPEGRYYADDLVGMAAVGVGGADLGRVQGVVPGLAHDLLQLSSGPLVPMVRAWVAIDSETRRVTVLMPLESVVDDAH